MGAPAAQRSQATPRFPPVLLLLLLLPPTPRGFHFADPTKEIVHAFDDALPRSLVTEVIREAMAAHDWEARSRPKHLRDSKASTNWMPIEQFDNPRSFAEIAISSLAKLAFPDDSPWTGGGPDGKEPTQMAGAEWWVQMRNTKENIGFHYDKDEGVASEEQWMKMPTMSSVFYLSDAGAPTLVLNKTTNRGGNKQDPIVPHTGYFSYPKKNRYFMFKGDLGHGVVGTLGSKKKRGKQEQRLTFLVNYWDKMPMEPYCRPLDDSMMRDMVGQEAMDRAAAAWPAVRARTGEYETEHRETRCAANQISLALSSPVITIPAVTLTEAPANGGWLGSQFGAVEGSGWQRRAARWDGQREDVRLLRPPDAGDLPAADRAILLRLSEAEQDRSA